MPVQFQIGMFPAPEVRGRDAKVAYAIARPWGGHGQPRGFLGAQDDALPLAIRRTNCQAFGSEERDLRTVGNPRRKRVIGLALRPLRIAPFLAYRYSGVGGEQSSRNRKIRSFTVTTIARRCGG